MSASCPPACRPTPGALPHQQWTDIYRESEPDGLGAPGSEPACDVALYEYVRAGTGSSAAGEWRRLSCVHGGAHSLITAQRLLQSPAVRGEGGQEGLLLGLADDVDCAVFRVAFAAAPKREGGVAPPTAADSAKPAAEARAEGEGAAAGSVQEELQRPAPGGTASQGPGAVSVVVAQEGCVPALAYVASGKTQRRHVLIGERATSVLVKPPHIQLPLPAARLPSTHWSLAVGTSSLLHRSQAFLCQVEPVPPSPPGHRRSTWRADRGGNRGGAALRLHLQLRVARPASRQAAGVKLCSAYAALRRLMSGLALGNDLARSRAVFACKPCDTC